MNSDGLGQGSMRSLIEFGLDTLPKGVSIKSAKLKMYYTRFVKPTEGHESPNPSTLYRLKQSWTESTVTWNNQPLIATSGIVIQDLAGSSDIEIDVTEDVKDMYLNGSKNFGWLLKNNTENPYVGMFFASSDNKDFSKNPELIIEFSSGLVTGLSTFESEIKSNIVFPNPSVSGIFEFNQEASGVIYMINGLEVATFNNISKIDLSSQEKGIYFIKTTNGEVYKVVSK